MKTDHLFIDEMLILKITNAMKTNGVSNEKQ